MSIKLALLKSGEQVIADIKELISDETGEKVLGYVLKQPQVVVSHQLDFSLSTTPEQVGNSVEIKMFPWILLSKDEDIAIPPDYVVTVVEPVEEVIKMYQEKTNGTSD